MPQGFAIFYATITSWVADTELVYITKLEKWSQTASERFIIIMGKVVKEYNKRLHSIILAFRKATCVLSICCRSSRLLNIKLC